MRKLYIKIICEPVIKKKKKIHKFRKIQIQFIRFQSQEFKML